MLNQKLVLIGMSQDTASATFDERWGLFITDFNMEMEIIDLLVEGLKSSPIAKGKIQLLQYFSYKSMSFSQVLTRF